MSETFAKWTRSHGMEDAETWSESLTSPTLNGFEYSQSRATVLVAAPSEMLQWSHQGRDVWTTDYATSLQVMGNMPGQGQALLTSVSEAFPARISALRELVRDWLASAADSGLSSTGCCPSCGLSGSLPRMFPASLASALALPALAWANESPNTQSVSDPSDETPLASALSAAQGERYVRIIAAVTSRSSSVAWKTSGTGGPTEYSTRDFSESPSGAVACSLSDVLETDSVPPKYWLSAKAATGILRRAEKRNKMLPPRLMGALAALASNTQ